MSPINSRAKGKRGEQDFINRILRPFWPEARRNVDQFVADKRDVLAVNGVHFQVKRTETLRIWEALAQASNEAAEHDLPVVAFKRNGGQWYCALEADELVALLRLREE